MKSNMNPNEKKTRMNSGRTTLLEISIEQNVPCMGR